MNPINAYQDRNNIVVCYPDGTRETRPSKYTAFFDAADWLDITPLLQSHSAQIEDWSIGKKWIRVDFKAGYYDKNSPNPHTGKPGRWVSYRTEFCKVVESYGFKTYEADVHPIRRWMVDENIVPGKPRKVYLDIESDSRETFASALSGGARMTVWAAVGEDGKEKTGCLKADNTSAEQDLFEELWSFLENYDTVIAYNGLGFDFPFLKARSSAIGSPCPFWRRLTFVDQLQVFKKYNVSSAKTGLEKNSYKLDNIATQLLGVGKHDLDASQAWEYWANPETRQQLVDYCLQDTKLLPLIEEKTGYLEVLQNACDTTYNFMDEHALKPTRQVESYLLKLGHEHDHRWPTRWWSETTDKLEEEEDKKFKGALVFQADVRGVIENVHACDYASLYPSIIVSWNISPETLADDGYSGPASISSKTNCRFRTDEIGMLPLALKNVMTLRKEWKVRANEFPIGSKDRKMAEYRSNACKIIANSFYGVMGNKYSRYYDVNVAESVTQCGVQLIELIKSNIEATGVQCIYLDTDSVFTAGGTRPEFQSKVDTANSVWIPNFLKQCGCKENIVSIAYDKEFSHLVFTAKKRYIGRHAGDAGTCEIKGLEVKRGDANALTVEMMLRIIDLFSNRRLDVAEYDEIVREYRERVLTGQLQRKWVVMSKSISKDLDDYSPRGKQGTLPAHVNIAKEMLAAGEDVSVGTRIGTIVVDASSSPMQCVADTPDVDPNVADRHYIWERVWEPNLRLLASMFPEYDWEQYTKTRVTKKNNPDQLRLF